VLLTTSYSISYRLFFPLASFYRRVKDWIIFVTKILNSPRAPTLLARSVQSIRQSCKTVIMAISESHHIEHKKWAYIAVFQYSRGTGPSAGVGLKHLNY
jgi:hypothetical protein